jgi:hypothetical protein
MALILAAITEDARKYWPRFFGWKHGIGAVTTPPTSWNPLLFSFKVGEGGWYNPGSGSLPRTPNPALRSETAPFLQDIDAIVDATRASPIYPADSRGWFEKALVISDLSFTSPSTLEVRCLLDLGDFNDDGNGNYPEIGELGIFTDHPDYARVSVGTAGANRLMVAYGTFPIEVKNPTTQIGHIVRLTF